MSQHIYLVGFMGSGKSTIGQALAQEMGRVCLDLDEVIEQREGMAIPEIFDLQGEPRFREIETRLLLEILDLPPAVVAVGGGAFIQDYNRNLILEKGFAVWLNIPIDLAWERSRQADNRPLARNRESFESLLFEREPLYRMSHLTVDIEGKLPEAICKEIVEKLTCNLNNSSHV